LKLDIERVDLGSEREGVVGCGDRFGFEKNRRGEDVEGEQRQEDRSCIKQVKINLSTNNMAIPTTSQFGGTIERSEDSR